MLVILIICPTILLIRYPTRLFRRCLLLEISQVAYVCGIISGTVQIWYSWLHDGFCILRIVLLAFFSTSPSIILTHTSILHVPPVSMLSQDCNFMDIIILFLLEILMMVTSITIVNTHYSVNNTAVTCLVLHMMLIFCVCHKLAKKIGITQCLKRRYNNLKICMQATRPTRKAEALIPCHTDWNHRRV